MSGVRFFFGSKLMAEIPASDITCGGFRAVMTADSINFCCMLCGKAFNNVKDAQVCYSDCDKLTAYDTDSWSSWE